VEVKKVLLAHPHCWFLLLASVAWCDGEKEGSCSVTLDSWIWYYEKEDFSSHKIYVICIKY
jgi:hypothetical protein